MEGGIHSLSTVSTLVTTTPFVEAVEIVETVGNDDSTVVSLTPQDLQAKCGICGTVEVQENPQLAVVGSNVEESMVLPGEIIVHTSTDVAEFSEPVKYDDWIEREHGLTTDELEFIWQQQDKLEQEANVQKKCSEKENTPPKFFLFDFVKVLAGDYKGKTGEVASITADGTRAWIQIITGYKKTGGRLKEVKEGVLLPIAFLEVIR